VRFPPIDAIRLVFAEEVLAARGAISRVYDVGGVLFARASLPLQGGGLTAGLALRVSDVEIEVRPAATWGAGECALIESSLGSVISLGDRDPVGLVRAGLLACLDARAFESIVAERDAASSRVIEHPGNVVLSLIAAFAQTGADSEQLLQLLPAIMDRVRGVARATDWAAVEAVALVAATVTDEATRWHLDVLAGRLLSLRPSTGRKAWAG
jgi:hypothetical protein